jgi:hypothetical protein
MMRFGRTLLTFFPIGLSCLVWRSGLPAVGGLAGATPAGRWPGMRDWGRVSSRNYWPQLDGVRAIAISAVIAYHLGYLPGGWIGVDIFFVLSGYLITTILLCGEETWGRLKGFWGSRAKRLLPAVLLLLVALSTYAGVGGPGLVPGQLRPPVCIPMNPYT